MLTVACFTIGWIVAGAIFVVATLFLLNFFRNPAPPGGHADNAILSPASGLVVQIRDVPDGEVWQGCTKQVSIFMNVFNIHVNRAPISGRIVHYRYNRGKKLAAFAEKSSIENEQNLVVVEGEATTVAFKQIAGLIARRIVFDGAEGDEVVRGQRIGMIKFGSRVDLFLPSSAELRVALRQKVAVGRTVIATAGESK